MFPKDEEIITLIKEYYEKKLTELKEIENG